MAARAHAANRPSTTLQAAYAAMVQCIIDRQEIHTILAALTKCTIATIRCVVTAAATNEAAVVQIQQL